MKLPVLVERTAPGGYVARVGPPFNWSAEGPSQSEAVSNLQAEVARHASNGAQIAAIEVPSLSESIDDERVQKMLVREPQGEHPWLKWAGTWDPNDPFSQEWEKGIQEYRRQRDQELDDEAEGA
jgi:hypothetical protein